MEAPIPNTRLTPSQKRNLRRTKSSKKDGSSYGLDYTKNKVDDTTTVDPCAYTPYNQLCRLSKIMSLLVLGTSAVVETETRVVGTNKNSFWIFMRLSKFEIKIPNPRLFHQLKIDIEEYEAATFLYEHGFSTGKVWIAIHSEDPFLYLRNDRFLYTEGKLCIIPRGLLSKSYIYYVITEMDKNGLPIQNRNRMLSVFTVERGLSIPTNLSYWEGHHDKESKFFICERHN